MTRMLPILILCAGCATAPKPATVDYIAIGCTAPTTNEDGSPLTDLDGVWFWRCTNTVDWWREGFVPATPGENVSWEDYDYPNMPMAWYTASAVDSNGNESATPWMDQ